MPFKYSTPKLLNWTYSEGALGNKLSYKSRADLKLHGPGKLELVFIDIICPNTSNLIIGYIYKHPKLHIGDSDSNYISHLLHKCSKESSTHTLSLGDFNIDQLKYESSELVNSLLDIMFSNFLST